MPTGNNTNTTASAILESISGKKLTLGNALRAIRKGEELSQKAFGEQLGISRQYLCDLERGRRFASPKAAFSYANILGYSPLQFVRLCLQDIVNKDGINLKIDVRAA